MLPLGTDEALARWARHVQVHEAVEVLHEATVDLPRLASIVQSRRVRYLLPTLLQRARVLTSTSASRLRRCSTS